MDVELSLFKTMLLIRRFEERLLAEFSIGKITGTTHTYIGQEANAAGIFQEIRADDVVFSNHRCHGHYLAYGGDPYPLAAELMGRVTGLVSGRGGSQHIQWRNFYTNGIQGGIVPVASGMALAEKAGKSGSIVLVFIGDGTLGEGVFYESMNIAALWQLPLLVVLEDNHYAQTTPREKGVAGSMAGRFAAFGIQVWEKETMDVLEIQTAAREALETVRTHSQPGGLILHTQRFMAHSKGDDTRPAEELERIRALDPVGIQGARLDEGRRIEVEIEVNKVIDGAFSQAGEDPLPLLDKDGQQGRK